MSKITIRRISAATVHDYRDIRLEALQRVPEAFSAIYDREVARPIEAFAERLETSVVLGAYCGDEIVGMAGLAPDTGPKEAHKFLLWGMYVRDDMRRQGVGAALVEAIVDHAPDTAEQITLAVVQGNEAAHALYARFGFTIYGVEPNALKRSDGYLDQILMVKFLWAPPHPATRPAIPKGA